MKNKIGGLLACIGMTAYLISPLYLDKFAERPVKKIEWGSGLNLQHVYFYKDGRAKYYHVMGSVNNFLWDSDGDKKIDGGVSYVVVPSTIGVIPYLVSKSKVSDIEEIIEKNRP